LLFALLALVFSATGAPARAGPLRPERAPAWDAPHAPGELIVKLPPHGRPAFARAGVQVLREVPRLGLALVRAPLGRPLAQAAADLEDAGVEWAEPNYTFNLDFIPNDPEYLPRQSAYLSRISAPAAWDLTAGRPEVVIAILDTGVYTNHVDLRDGIWTNPGEIPGNGLDDEGNGFVDDVHGWDFADNDNEVLDDHGHGTHVAGIAAARIDNGLGIAGVAGRATIMPVDVFGGGIGTYEDLIRAIVYATDNGARVINMSLGASSYSLGEEAAVNYAYSHGVVLVAAAGNSGLEEQHYPAAHANVIAVAATASDDSLAWFSIRGDWVDVAAPGVSIYSTIPPNGLGESYGSKSGTSMATPHVAALAALALSRNPLLTPDQVRAVIESTADDLGPGGKDIYYGNGRINAARALAATVPSDELPPTPGPGPGLDMDLPGCKELLGNGGFEDGLAAWQARESVLPDNDIRAEGDASAKFAGGPSSRGEITQTVTIPGDASAAVLKFLYRIDPLDYGRGASPGWPFDDWFTVEWRTPEGETLGQLLRTGNTADTVNGGLEWDEYYYRMDETALAALRNHGPASLVFTAQNDSDSFPTDVWVDDVRFCLNTGAAPLPVRTYLPLVGKGN
jgi:hypothetical protein